MDNLDEFSFIVMLDNMYCLNGIVELDRLAFSYLKI